MTEHIVLIGAGSCHVTRGLLADIIRRNQPVELSLVDIDRRRWRWPTRLARKMIEARKAPVTVRASVDRRDVLAGPPPRGGLHGRRGRRRVGADVYIPRKYGIYQPVAIA